MKRNKISPKKNCILKSVRTWQISYEFAAIPNWQERLASAYEMLFVKIEEIEKSEIKEKDENEKI